MMKFMSLLIFHFFIILNATLAAQEEVKPFSDIRDRNRRVLLGGTHVLRRIIIDFKLETLDSTKALTSAPEKKILVIFGDLAPLEELAMTFPGGLEGFLRKGGAVLIASDRQISSPKSRNQLIGVAGVTINQEPLKASRPEDCYQQIKFCPMVKPILGAKPDLFFNPIHKDRPLTIFCNTPSMLQIRSHFPEEIRPLATLPFGSLLETPEGLVMPENDLPLFGVGGNFDKGQLIVLADHSLFINQMMMPNDTENVEFCYNLFTLLKGKNGQRTDLLLFEDGVIQTALDAPLTNELVFPFSKILNAIFDRRNELISTAGNKLVNWEDENLFNRMFFEYLESANFPPWRLLRLLLLLGTLISFCLLIYFLGVKKRYRNVMESPPITSALSRIFSNSTSVNQIQTSIKEEG